MILGLALGLQLLGCQDKPAAPAPPSGTGDAGIGDSGIGDSGIGDSGIDDSGTDGAGGGAGSDSGAETGGTGIGDTEAGGDDTAPGDSAAPEEPTCTWPETGWPDALDEAEVALEGADEGWDSWQVPPDLVLSDQLGGTVHTRQFYGNVVVIELAAGWCSYCVAEAATWAAMYADYRADGECMVWLTVLTEDAQQEPASVETAAEWADTFGSAHPVLADPDKLLPASLGEEKITYPTYIILDTDFQVRALIHGEPSGGDSLIRGYINGLL